VLGALPIEFRLPLVLTDIAELSIAEAAEVLGLKPATVKTRVHRARLKLRKALDRSLPQKEEPRTEPAEVCLSMLEAKQEALDRGVAFPYSDRALCERCRAVFATLDLGREACSALGTGALPPALRERLRRRLGAACDGGDGRA
jgi:predicted RNA polymerase sigma factor